MAVPVEADSSFRTGAPELLFDGPFQTDDAGHASYDVSPDGQKFLMIRNESTGRVELRVVPLVCANSVPVVPIPPRTETLRAG